MFKDVLDFLSFDYKFDTKSYGFPFNKNREDVTFSWGQLCIPKYGIREVVTNKISDINKLPIEELKMLYQIPFVWQKPNDEPHFGIVNENISLTFRYDKTYKYGDITKSIYECCFFIVDRAKETNDFYILDDEALMQFMREYVIPNQWGLGATLVTSGLREKYGYTIEDVPSGGECVCEAVP